MLRRVLLTIVLGLACFQVRELFTEEPGLDAAGRGAPINWQMPTFGGMQYWADEQIAGPLRIQRNVNTGHYRLLNGSDERLAWGTYPQCAAKLAEIRRLDQIKPPTTRVVILLHGMARTRHSMDDIAAAIRKVDGADVVSFGYPSLQEDVPALARSFDLFVRRLGADGVLEIDVVAYSMGNLVTRYWLGEVAAQTAAAGGVRPPNVPQLRRYVMLGPPNHGAQRANLWMENTIGRELFNFAVGDGGQQLGPRFHEIKDRLATPEAEFGIIAGGKGDGVGWHDGIDGDDDGTVGVRETQLAGATDFVVVPLKHRSLLHERESLEKIASFLKNGYFTAAEARHPLLSDHK
ncbi:MAG: hypothetical protein JNL96_06310 [Planctomycetaceae bacterium]|nr:hypothetical protein [Planctomycetaceae bacterium]